MDVLQLNNNIKIQYHNAGAKGSGVVLCMVDSGVTPIKILKNAIAGNEQGLIDHRDHGTGVAYLAMSLCPDAALISYNVFPNGNDSIAAVIASLKDILARAKADRSRRYLVNMSISGHDLLLPELDAIGLELTKNNVSVFCAAGNLGQDATDYAYPASYQWPFTVTALTPNAKLAQFSSWLNETDFSDHGEKVQILRKRGGISESRGTSLSSPILCGKAGLVLSKYYNETGRWLTDNELYVVLKAMSVDLGKTGRDPQFGYGFVDISKDVDIKNIIGHIDNTLPQIPETPVSPTPPTSPTQPIPTPDKPKTTIPYIAKYTGATGVNIRTGGSTSFNKIGILSSGEKCVVIAENNGWVEVVLHERAEILRGWCIVTYLQAV